MTPLRCGALKGLTLMSSIHTTARAASLCVIEMQTLTDKEKLAGPAVLAGFAGGAVCGGSI